MSVIQGRFARRGYKRYFPLERKRFSWFSCHLSEQLLSPRSPFLATLHKKGSRNKVISLKQGSEMSDFSLNRVPVWRSRRPDTSPQTSSVSPFPFPTPIPGADTSKFRQYCLLQGWQISLTGEYSILNQTNIPIWTGYRLDPQASQAHAFTEVSRERTQFPKRICGIPYMDVWTRLV